jgi:hypothetical protein
VIVYCSLQMWFCSYALILEDSCLIMFPSTTTMRFVVCKLLDKLEEELIHIWRWLKSADNVGILLLYELKPCWSLVILQLKVRQLHEWVLLFGRPARWSEHGIKMNAPLEVCTENKQHTVTHFLVSKGKKGTNIDQQLAAKYRQDCLPQWSVHEWIKMFNSSQTSAVGINREGCPSTSTNKIWSRLKQWFLKAVG